MVQMWYTTTSLTPETIGAQGIQVVSRIILCGGSKPKSLQPLRWIGRPPALGSSGSAAGGRAMTRYPDGGMR